jgi:hypothetical protein
MALRNYRKVSGRAGLRIALLREVQKPLDIKVRSSDIQVVKAFGPLLRAVSIRNLMPDHGFVEARVSTVFNEDPIVGIQQM